MSRPSLSSISRSRHWQDRLTQYMVTGSGGFVLLMMAAIFIYLLSMILPIFLSSSLVIGTPTKLPVTQLTDTWRWSTKNNWLYQWQRNGEFQAIQLAESQQTVGALPRVVKTLAFPPILSGKVSQTDPDIFAYQTLTGLVLAKLEFSSTAATADPMTIAYPMGKAILPVDFSSVTSWGVMTKGAELRLMLSRKNGSSDFWVWSDGQLKRQGNLPSAPKSTQSWLFSQDGVWAYAVGRQQIVPFRFTDGSWQAHSGFSVSSPIRHAKLLAGDHSLLLALQSNQLQQWFEVADEGRRVWREAREFTLSNSSITNIMTDSFRKYFYVQQQNGHFSAFYSLNDDPMATTKFDPNDLRWIKLSPDGYKLLWVGAHHWRWITPDWASPSLHWKRLFLPVWYENYQQPEHVWQSYSVDGGQESKFGLMPLLFGTVKATILALFFAVPLALAGAIYTAYFMSSSLRRWVKPTIELMEALPTVILGFLAALWFAPLLEKHLLGIGLFLGLLPLSICVIGLLWSFAVQRWHWRISAGWHILLLIPCIVLTAWGSLSLGATLGTMWFGGDVQHSIRKLFGWGYEQRNALVIGMTLGFAVVPTIFTLAEDAIHSVPKHLIQGAMALGATHWQTLKSVVLPTASSGLFSAVMMGLGRAIGETMIIIMVTGNTPIMDWNLFNGLRSLSATIAIEMPKSNVASEHYRVLFLGAFLLFLFTFIINTIAEIIRQRLREKYQTL